MNYKRKFTYSRKDVACQYCTEYRGKGHKCPHAVCPYMAERIEAGAVTYGSAILAMIPRERHLVARLPSLLPNTRIPFSRMIGTNPGWCFLHHPGFVPSCNTPSYLCSHVSAVRQ